MASLSDGADYRETSYPFVESNKISVANPEQRACPLIAKRKVVINREYENKTCFNEQWNKIRYDGKYFIIIMYRSQQNETRQSIL